MKGKEATQMKVIIIGGGKVGYYLLKTLIEHGHEPTIIEIDKKTCTAIANELDVPVVYGDGTNIDLLEKADLANCDAVLAVSGRDENNLVACQLAKRLVPGIKTVARVNNPKNAEIMKILGIDNVISSTNTIAEMLERSRLFKDKRDNPPKPRKRLDIRNSITRGL